MSAPAALFSRRLLLFVLLILVAGCGRVAFVGDRYDNFTAYYNTFYNAERSYKEAVDALDNTTEPIDRQVYISVFPAPGRAINDQKFQAAIDKSADVLRDHPDSKWVDDALLLIGKSYYYQHNFPGAEQKFREAIDRASVLEDEARLWLARTLIGSGSYDEARNHLLESLNRDDLAERWEPSLRLAMGELLVKRGSFAEAVDELREGLASIRDNDLEARGWFLLGQVYETLGQYAEAASAYEQVTSAHPRYELSYAAQLSAVRVKGMHVDAESALREIRRLERDDKNYSNRFELAFVRGRIYHAEGYAGDARALYENILYDSDEQIGDVRGRVHYALGELYRDAFHNYELASAHFDTARSALQAPASSGSSAQQGSALYTSEAITNAPELADMFGSFAAVRQQISEMDSLLHLGTLDEDEFAAKIFEIRTRMAEELAEQERRAERMQAARGFQNAGIAGDAASRQQSAAAQNEATGSAGFLFHRDPVRVQEGRMNFILRWGERPHAPNWRRTDAIEDATASADSAGELPEQRLRDLDPSVGEEPLPPLDYSDVPRDSLSRAALRAKRAAARYELANVLFLSMEQPDSAAYWYRLVIEEDEDFQVAQRAFYALAEVQRSLGDTLAANRLYEEVLRDFPESDFAGRVREQLGIREDVPSDTLALAEEHYDQAFQRWRRGSYRDAMNRMVEVAAAYPHMEVAPRALLAAGRIYLEWSDRDRLDVFGPLPFTVADSILNDAGLLRIADESLLDSQYSENALAEPSDSVDLDELGDPSEEQLARAASDDLALEDGAADSTRVAVKEIPVEGAGEPADSTTGARVTDDVLSGTEPDSTTAPDADVRDDELTYVPEEAAEDSMIVRDSGNGAYQALPSAQPVATADSSDLARAATDSVSADLPRAATDSVSAEMSDQLEAGNHIYLETLYAGVKENYPQTSYAEAADELLRALKDRRQELQAAADSAAAAVASQTDDSLDSTLAAEGGLVLDSTLVIGEERTIDSTLASASNSVRDSTQTVSKIHTDTTINAVADAPIEPGIQVVDPDTTIDLRRNSPGNRAGRNEPVSEPDSLSVARNEPPEIADDTTLSPRAEEASIPQGEASIRADGGVRPELGGYTLVLATGTREEPMVKLAAKYAEQGFRADVLKTESGGQTTYHAVLGHFETLREGGSMMQKYASQIEENVQVHPLDELQ